MWIEREISRELQEITKTFPVLALIGPRQVGKTSILERVFPDYAYISLDLASHAEAAETRSEEFLDQHPPPAIFDEIQYAPSFLRYIKTRVDARKGENGLYVLTGSQNFMLMEAVAESLAGRAAVVPFLGLSASEWKQAEDASRGFRWVDFLWRGSFPALWAVPDHPPSRERWYQGYVATYLERDVRNLLNIGSLRDFERFIRACAARCGQSLNLSEIGRDVGVSSTTTRQWLSVLQASNQILLLEPYFRSLGKRLVKTPKLYFTDTGLAAYLMGFSSADAMWSSHQAGALWENHVISQWLRWRDWREPSTSLWYWRDQAGHEVDLLIEKDQKLIAVECKLTGRPGSKDLKGIKKLEGFYGQSLMEHSYLACPIEKSFDLDEGITAVPGWTVWHIGVGPH